MEKEDLRILTQRASKLPVDGLNLGCFSRLPRGFGLSTRLPLEKEMRVHRLRSFLLRVSNFEWGDAKSVTLILSKKNGLVFKHI